MVLAALAGDDGLSADEDARWIDTLMQRGMWGQAYAHWAGTLPEGAILSPVFNGGFEGLPTNSGFDWRTPVIPGQTVSFEPVDGASGQAAVLQFRGRPAARGGLEQALLLAPGPHRLQLRLRSNGLRSDGGLEWLPARTGAGSWVAVTGSAAASTGER
ncbi:hypothetical protein H1235_00675 [Pseudoxanthomonas sp. NC8]|nr:hypothetical protein H1235_00675 [Pseudoxanthomonas sp. NC8]